MKIYRVYLYGLQDIINKNNNRLPIFERRNKILSVNSNMRKSVIVIWLSTAELVLILYLLQL